MDFLHCAIAWLLIKFQTLAASSIALSKASCSRFRRSISPLSAEIFQVVRIANLLNHFYFSYYGL